MLNILAVDCETHAKVDRVEARRSIGVKFESQRREARLSMG